MILTKLKNLNILTRDEIIDIHLATLDILEDTGVIVDEEYALGILKNAGAKVDEKDRHVWIPASLVKESIRKAPRRFTLYARNPKKNLRFGGHVAHFAPGGKPNNVVDIETGKYRFASLKDLENLVRLVDALESIHLSSNMVSIHNVPDSVSDILSVLVQAKNTSKCIEGNAVGRFRAQNTLRMGAVIAGGIEEFRKKPTLYGIVNPISPLKHGREMLEGLIEYSKQEAPIIIASEVMAGATGPATLAGLLTQQNAEVLSGIVISQLVNPGTPVMYGNVSSIMDMKTGTVALGAIEAGLINLAWAQMSKYYGIPCRGTAGNADSKIPDVQSGYEKAFGLLLAALGGTDFVFDAAGLVNSSLAFNYEQIVIDSEILGMVLRAMDGIEVSNETLALDLICETGPGGHYLSKKHTLEWFRKEHFVPKISDRNPREKWENAGSKDLRVVAKERVKEILDSHQPEPLDKNLRDELEKIVREMQKKINKVQHTRN